MKGLLASAASAAIIGLTSAALPPVHVKGSKFFNKNGEQFFMKGIAYQAEVNTQSTNAAAGGETKLFNDPLADIESCRRDVPYLKDLGTNTIRVYAIDPEKDQDECMALLDEAGIYVIADLSQPGESVNRDSPSWDDVLYARYTSVVDKMSKYSNTLGFFAGNEVTNNVTNTNASPYVKAAVRDMKAYIKEKGYRTIPVGYATNDDAEVRLNLANYFNCGPAEESIDFWGYNIYSWCGKSSFQKSGFDKRTEEFKNYNVPVFFAEYGCNEVQPRPFTEVETLYGPEMTDVWSGGIVYMYFQEANDYGLVTVSGDEVTTNKDYDNLKSQIENVSPKGVRESSYDAGSLAAQTCPAVGDDWRASADLPPKPNKELCGCMVQGLECVVDPKVKKTAYGDIFGFICGDDGLGAEGCTGIASDGENGVYGSFSMCSAEEKLSWAMNAYAKKNGASSCDFEGQATTQQASTSGTCDSQIESAGGAEGTTVSSSGGTTSTSKKGAAASMTAPSTMGLVAVAAFFGSVGLFAM